jgi:hypothetical protein
MTSPLPAFVASGPLQHRLVLAAGGGANQPGGQGQEFGSSGPVALILIIVLFVAVVFLIRSMSKHLKRVPASFDQSDAQAGTDADVQADSPVDEAPAADGAQPAPDGTEIGHGSER